MKFLKKFLESCSKAQAVKANSLSYVGSVDVVDDFELSERQFVKTKRCYNNAVSLAVLRKDEVVVGYVYIPEFGVFIEHAWNYSSVRGHYDLTSQFCWSDGLLDSYKFIELVRFSYDEAMDIHFEGGLDHMTLRRHEVYRNLFR